MKYIFIKKVEFLLNLHIYLSKTLKSTNLKFSNKYNYIHLMYISF